MTFLFVILKKNHDLFQKLQMQTFLSLGIIFHALFGHFVDEISLDELRLNFFFKIFELANRQKSTSNVFPDHKMLINCFGQIN